MNIGKIKDWSYENWQTIMIVSIILTIGVSVYNYDNENEQKYKECKEFELIDKFEKNEVSWGYIIYYSDGRIEKSRDLPACIKLKK